MLAILWILLAAFIVHVIISLARGFFRSKFPEKFADEQGDEKGGCLFSIFYFFVYILGVALVLSVFDVIIKLFTGAV